MTYRNGNEANDREVKFKGSWYGIINTTSKAKPDEIVNNSFRRIYEKFI